MNSIQRFLLDHIPTHPKDVVKIAMAHFDKTRPGIIYHLNILKDKGMISWEGSTKGVSYFLIEALRLPDSSNSTAQHVLSYQVGEKAEDEIWKQDILPLLDKDLPLNIHDICQFGITEMINNVIDHSLSKYIRVSYERQNQNLVFKVIDGGVGIFKKIAGENNLSDIRDAALRLQQGKFTSDPTRHSGQGIFFTSKAFDHFILQSNGLFFHKNNIGEPDWFLETQDEQSETGTIVELSISVTSSQNLKKVFDTYTDSETQAFNKTHIAISLGKFTEDNFVSRSQAKRLLAGLDRTFKFIMLDFKNIRSVGQAFVDEVFRVFWLNHPNIHFIIENANSDIQFMIQRNLADTPELKNKITFSNNKKS